MDLLSKLDSFETPNKAIEAFKDDKHVLEALLVLAGRGDADFTVKHRLAGKLRVLVCKSSVDCKKILIAKERSDNAEVCETCRSAMNNAERSVYRKADVTRTAPNSSVPITSLDSTERKERMANRRDEKKKDKRTIVRLTKEINALKKNLTNLTLHFDGSQGNTHLDTSADGLREETRHDIDSEERAEADHQIFMSDTRTIFKDISKN